MQDKNVTETIVLLVQERLNELNIIGPIPHAVNLRDLGLTSLALIDLISGLEQAFQFNFPEIELASRNFETVDAICCTVNRVLMT